MMVRDVVIHTTEGLFQDSACPICSVPAPRGRFDLSDDLWVGKLDEDIAEKVLDGCEPSGPMARKSPRQYGQLYAFVRERAPVEPPYQWDSDSRLQMCVALSRLVHPTSISFRYSARIIYSDNAKVEEIVPGGVVGYGADAYVPTEGHRDWLVAGDFDALKLLVRHLPLSHLPPRVWRALWYHEYAARTRDIGIRWTFIATALEALVHTDRPNSTRQFVGRVSRLALDLGSCEFSEDDAAAAYDCRSSLSHGQGLSDLTKEKQQLYERMDAVLREALMRSIQEPEFAKIFATDGAIRSRWPLAI